MKFRPSKMTMDELNARSSFLAKLQILCCSIVIVCSIFGLASNAKADCDEIYLKIGTGYKVSETEYIQNVVTGQKMDIISDPYSARIESGVECGNLTWGVSHHSQWRTGEPFNDRGELSKTEIFIDYRFSWGI